MAGYSTRPLAAKLGVKPGSVVVIDFAPGVKVAAIDSTWSGLKFVRRLSDR